MRSASPERLTVPSRNTGVAPKKIRNKRTRYVKALPVRDPILPRPDLMGTQPFPETSQTGWTFGPGRATREAKNKFRGRNPDTNLALYTVTLLTADAQIVDRVEVCGLAENQTLEQIQPVALRLFGKKKNLHVTATRRPELGKPIPVRNTWSGRPYAMIITKNEEVFNLG